MPPQKKIMTSDEILEHYEKLRIAQNERNKKYYNKKKDTVEWKRKRNEYYLKRKELKLQEQAQLQPPTSSALS